MPWRLSWKTRATAHVNTKENAQPQSGLRCAFPRKLLNAPESFYPIIIHLHVSMTDVHLVLVFILFGFSDKVLDATEVEAGNQYDSDT